MAVMGRMKKWSGWSQSQMLAAMLAVHVFATGQQLLSKVALSQGSFIFALTAYRHLVAALCVAPLAFFLERENSKKMGCSTWFWLFINALTGKTAAMGLFYCGLGDTTATYSSNFLIVTFVFSIIFCKAGKVKTAGALLCVGGALTASLYKGKVFHLANGHHFHRTAAMEVSKSHWTRGTFMLVGSCVCYASWYILQVKLLKVFPWKYKGTLLTCIIASIQSAVIGLCLNKSKVLTCIIVSIQSAAIGLCLNRSKAAWRLEWNLQLFTIIYSGALSTAATFCLLTWSIAKRGPTYAPMFNPLALVFVAISEALVLGEEMRMGIVLGTVLIIVGLYSFLWGKKEELKRLPLSNEGVDKLATAIPVSVELKTLEPV